MVKPEDFLDNKRDFSPFLVHLTKDEIFDDEHSIPAKDILDTILSEKTLKAFNHFCLFSRNLKEPQGAPLTNEFKVVCFTETPIDQIDMLLKKVSGRKFKPEPYGLVFRKEYIRAKEGNPVFYVTNEIANPLWQLYWPLRAKGIGQSPDKVCKLLALVTVCKEGNDWHWEREWRIVGNLEFDLKDIYFGLCPEEDIPYFETKYSIKFISPYWKTNKILENLLQNSLPF